MPEKDEGTGQREAYLAAIVALLLEERQSRDSTLSEKPEVLLNRVGMARTDIAMLVGKNPDAVRKTISRAATTSAEGDEH